MGGEPVGAHADVIIADLRRRLQQVRRVKIRRRLLRGVIITALAAGLVVSVLLAVESLFPMSAPVRTAAVLVGSVCVAGWALYGVLYPLLRGIVAAESDIQTAAEVGNTLPELRDRAVNALQIHQEAQSPTPLGSPELVGAALEDLQKQVLPADFVGALPARRLGPLASTTGAVFVALSTLVLLFPETLGASGERLIHFTRDFVKPPLFTLAVTPGSQDIIRGLDVEIRAVAIGTPPPEARLQLKPEDQVTFDDQQMSRDEAGEFHATLRSLRQSVEYRVVAGDQSSEFYRLRVMDRPIIRVLRLSLEFPSYTRLAARQLDDNVGDVLAVKGTMIQFRVESSAELAQAELVVDGRERRSLAVSGARATGSLRLERDQSYHIRLVDAAGTANADPVEYHLRTLADRPPSVRIELPGRDLDVTETSVVDLVIRIEDDFGFTALHLVHRLVESRYEPAAEEGAIVDIALPSGLRGRRPSSPIGGS